MPVALAPAVRCVFAALLGYGFGLAGRPCVSNARKEIEP